MTKILLVTVFIATTSTAYSQRDCLESSSFDKRMKRAFKVERKIGRRQTQRLNKAEFDEYIEEPNNSFVRLTIKRNRLIFENCERRCNSSPKPENFKDVKIVNVSEAEHIDLFDSGVVKVEDLVNCSGCERNYRFYQKSWANDSSEKTLEIWEYSKLESRDKDSQKFEIWVKPNNYNDLRLVYFIKITNDKCVCVVPAVWVEI